MATMSQEGIFGVGSGILHPKQSRQFLVRFGEDKPICESLSQQIIKTTGFELNKSGPKNITIVMEDDQTNRGSKDLDQLAYLASFGMRIEKFDASGNVASTILFKNCKITSIQHSSLDYGASIEQYAFSIQGPYGNLRADDIDLTDPTSQLIYTISKILSAMKMTSSATAQKSEVLITKTINIEYDSATETYSL